MCALCSNGVIDREELKALLQSTDGGFEPVTLVGGCYFKACRCFHLRVLSNQLCKYSSMHKSCSASECLSLSPADVVQDWMRDSEVRETLQKYDWDGSGDIDFYEFEGLVLPLRPALCSVKTV